MIYHVTNVFPPLPRFADQMLGISRPCAVHLPQRQLCQCGALPTRTGPLWLGVSGAVCGIAVSSRPAHDTARDICGSISGPRSGAHLACIAHIQR